MEGFTVVPAVAQDIEWLCMSLSQADLEEADLIHPGVPIPGAVYQSLYDGPAWTVLSPEDRVLAMLGVVPTGPPGLGCPWLLQTEEFLSTTQYRRQFLTVSPGYLMEFHRHFPVLSNHVSRKHKAAVRWLRWLGFSFEPTAHPDILLFKRVLSNV